MVGLRKRLLEWIWLGWVGGREEQDMIEIAEKRMEGTDAIKKSQLRIPNPFEFPKVMLWKDTTLIL